MADENLEEDELDSENLEGSVRTQRAENRTTQKRWTVLDDGNNTEVPVFHDVELFCDAVKYPLSYFQIFFDKTIIDEIVNQTNIYSVQKNPNKPCNLTSDELEQWIGLVFYFSVSKLPNTRMHWSRLLGPLSEVAAGIMNRNRFETIKSNLHLADNSILELDPEKKKDKLFKVRLLIEHFQNKFRNIPMTSNLSVDEQMVPFKGKSQLRQYLPNKPTKWGYKFVFWLTVKG